MPESWVVVPTCLPTIVRRCHACASERFRTSGKFRVKAHHKRLDAWLLALCTVCGCTTKLTAFERTSVRSVRPDLLDRLHRNDPDLTAELLQDPADVERLVAEGRLTSTARLGGKLSGDLDFTLRH